MRSKFVSAVLLVMIAGHLAAQEKNAATILRAPTSAVEILRKFDIGDSQLGNFFSGQPLGPAEEEVLAKIFYRWPRFGQENVEAWRQKEVTWDQLVADPVQHRGEIHHFRGRAVKVSQVKLPPEIVERLEIEHYFAVHIRPVDSPYVGLIYARFVPAAWKLDGEMDEPVSVDGLFLKVGDAASDPPPLLFAAERVAWHPDKPRPEQFLGTDQVALAQAGVDWGLYEVVKEANGGSLGGADREPFYQTLAAIGGKQGSKLPPATAKVDIPLLLQKSETLLGSRLKLEGTARRITKVTVSAEDIRKRFGIDHYYEIDVSVPLDKPMKLAKNPKAKDALLYSNDFPLTLIVPRLPANLQEGENLHDLVSAEGTFYKLWTYQSSYASQKNMKQAAPLLIGSEVRLMRKGNPLAGISSAIVTGAMLLAGGTFFLIYFWFRISDRKSVAARPAETIQDAIRQGAAKGAEEPPNFDGLK